MPLAMDSDPNSTLNVCRTRLHEANLDIGRANRGMMCPSAAMRRRNEALVALREVAYYLREQKYTPKRKEAADFDTEVCGIPCGVVVDFYTPGRPWRQHNSPGAGPGDCDIEELEDFEWHLVDRKGYRAKWLEEKMNGGDVDRIEAMIRSGNL